MKWSSHSYQIDGTPVRVRVLTGTAAEWESNGPRGGCWSVFEEDGQVVAVRISVLGAIGPGGRGPVPPPSLN